MNDKRYEIAKEVYLDLILRPNCKLEDLAKHASTAITAADVLLTALSPSENQNVIATKGCPACFGSVGPRKSPCKKCSGTGRVVA